MPDVMAPIGGLNSTKININLGPCSVTCDHEQEIVVVPIETVNELLASLGATKLETAKAAVGQITNISDVHGIVKIYREFGRRGSAYMKTVNGRTYIIFKGTPGLRSMFRGTRYLANNSKVVRFGIGRLGAARSIKVGTIWSIAFVNAWNIGEFILSDEMTLADLGVQIASDTSKVVIASLFGLAAAAAAAGTIALAPLAVGVVVAVGVGLLLDHVDSRYQITESIKKWANETADEIGRAGAREMLNKANSARAAQMAQSIPPAWRGFFGFKY